MPCLPVDSATSCSSHSPRPGRVSEMTNVSLSRPACASALRAAPSHTPPAARRSSRRRASSPSCSMPGLPGARRSLQAARATSTPISARRHDAEGGQRAVAPADVRVAGEHLPEAVLWRRAASRPEPGSVIATKLGCPPRRATRSARTATAARSCRRTSRRRGTAFAAGRSRCSTARIRGGVGRVQHVQARRGRRRCRRSSAAAPPGRARSRPCRAGRRRAVPSSLRLRGEQLQSAELPEHPLARSSASRGGWRSPGCRRDPRAWRLRWAILPATSSLRGPRELVRDGGLEGVGDAGLDGEVGIAHARIVVGLGARVGFEPVEMSGALCLDSAPR